MKVASKQDIINLILGYLHNFVHPLQILKPKSCLFLESLIILTAILIFKLNIAYSHYSISYNKSYLYDCIIKYLCRL